MRYENKSVLIIGLGESGKACKSFLEKRGARCVVYDDFSSSTFCASDLSRLDFAVVSPGISLKHALLSRLRENGIPVLSEIDLAFLNCKSKNVFAVSGTNGKTTVCSILGEMLSTERKTYVLGNIGVPFISQAAKIRSRDLVVLEISSFQIEQSVVFKPFAACLTNVGEDHLDRHLTKERYRSIKLSLLKNAKYSVKNADDRNQASVSADYTYGLSEGADYRLIGREIVCAAGRFRLSEISRGKAFDLDFLCAFALSSSAFRPDRKYLKAYSSVKLPPFRNEFVGTFCGAEVFNDSKGTNIDATLFACSLREQPTALILGGSDKGESYARLSKGIGSRIERVYLTGANAAEIYSSADPAFRAKCVLMPDLESCLIHFKSDPLSALLFSPASASFDRYSDYVERGERFNALLEKHGARLIR